MYIIRIYICIYLHVYIYIRRYVYICMYIYIYVYKYVYIYMYLILYVYVYIHICMYMFIHWYVYICIYVYIYGGSAESTTMPNESMHDTQHVDTCHIHTCCTTSGRVNNDIYFLRTNVDGSFTVSVKHTHTCQMLNHTNASTDHGEWRRRRHRSLRSRYV